VRHDSRVRDYVFRLDVTDDTRRDALSQRIEDHLWGDGVTFDRWTMRLTVTGDTEDDALKIARAVVRASTKDTDLYSEPLAD
jgi:hypothetical protein